jgi:hypothetical protein
MEIAMEWGVAGRSYTSLSHNMEALILAVGIMLMRVDGFEEG